MTLKYPVITKNNTYQVKIYRKYITCGWYQWICEVQIKTKILWFETFKTVHAISFDDNDYSEYYLKYRYDFVQLAIDTVNNYEKKIERQKRLEQLRIKNIKQWESWDGIIK